ncbi:MAG TPA: DUF1003 domain-containing protein [Polyangiaceae bacterium]
MSELTARCYSLVAPSNGGAHLECSHRASLNVVLRASQAAPTAPFDPSPFFFLQGAIAFYAAIMATMILVTQNRQRKDEERNAHLELQVNLLAEQRTGKIVALLEELQRDLPNVRDRVDPVADALQKQVLPTAVNLCDRPHHENTPLAEERVAEERAELEDDQREPDPERRA